MSSNCKKYNGKVVKCHEISRKTADLAESCLFSRQRRGRKIAKEGLAPTVGLLFRGRGSGAGFFRRIALYACDERTEL